MKRFAKFFICSLLLTATAAATYANSFKDHTHGPSIKPAEAPKLEDKASFSIIVLGDPQSYTKFDFNQPVFELLTAWAAAQKNNLNVKTVICTGDLVEQNDLQAANGGTRYPNGNCGNQPSLKQWQSVSRAFERLDNIYPYVLATGNHDYGYESAENRISEFPKYFDVSRNPLWAKTLVASFENAFGKRSLENAAYEFHDANWGDILIVSLEFSPRDEALQWAESLINSSAYKNHKVILLTHSLLDTSGNIIQKEGYKLSPCNYPAQIMEKLIRPSKNIKLAICGHSCDETTFAAFRTEKNADGKDVRIMMFNPQAISGWDGNGGDGWLRILEFKPDGKTIKAKTYSPLFGFSPSTEKLAWKRGDKYEFGFEIAD